ncbi:MAG: hypothetical protein Q7R40_05120 [Phaeospirillum sp.]|nr:hypothetical protein [Phaeospirillum sp.]
MRVVLRSTMGMDMLEPGGDGVNGFKDSPRAANPDFELLDFVVLALKITHAVSPLIFRSSEFATLPLFRAAIALPAQFRHDGPGTGGESGDEAWDFSNGRRGDAGGLHPCE